jgi:cytochrome d ubiquinol oxidase subunit II
MNELFGDLQFLWFTAFVTLLAGYCVLDGFDLGVGMLHLFSKKDHERRLMLNTIGPLWDGNAVWLVTAGGALFAGFPLVYTTICSTFYIPVMLLLSSFIFRAVAIEFRSKQPGAWWRWTWDVLFSLASLLITLVLGVLIGNLIRGIPLDQDHQFTGELLMLFNPYALLTGILAISLFAMHGATFLLVKTEGELHDRIRSKVNPAIILFTLCYAVTTVVTLIYMPHMTEAMKQRPLFLLVALLNILAVANIPREINRGNDWRAFLSSCGNIICLLALYGIGTYPNAVRALDNSEQLSLTIYNSSSSPTTLSILLLIALIGLPMVISYTTMIYWIFRGKVKLDATSY